MKHARLFRLLCALLLGAGSAALAGDETADPYAQKLLGDAGGIRKALSDYGIDPTLEYKADFSAVTSGRNPGTNYLDNLDLKFAIDGEKLFGLPGNKAFLYFLNNNGGKPNRRIGSLQGVNNIEVGTNTPKLYEAWVDQSFFSNKLSILVGLHDLNSEFNETDLTANFLEPSFQIGPEFSQSGLNGPSIFPTTSLAARLKITPTDTTCLQAAIFDAVSGDPDNAYGTRIRLNGHDGALLVAEAGFTPKPLAKFAIGAWSYTKAVDDLIETDTAGNPAKSHSRGAYFLSTYQFYHEGDHALGAFFRIGIADGDTNPIDLAYQTGLTADGWIPTRPDGEFGLGLAQTHNGDKFVQATALERTETDIDLYYRDQLYPGISIQPDIQVVRNPGTDPKIDNATVLALRLDINF